MRKVLAYFIAIIGWLGGIFLGTIWALLYGGYQQNNVIDLPTLIMENILPAIVSVYLSNYLFEKIYPTNDINFDLHKKIINILLIINYSFILCETIYFKNYSNIIYVITGIIYSGYNIINNQRIEN
ncbi:MAG: hypothetical protein E7161_04385 [Firmicutes bacterium]|nr:hypothetical protein [Bacillota bacterium]